MLKTRIFQLLVVALAATGMTACGSSPTSASSSSSVTSISILGFSQVASYITFDYPYSLLVTYSNGTSANVTSGVSWSFSNPQIGRINSTTGVLTNIEGRTGSGVVTATYSGKSATKTVNAI